MGCGGGDDDEAKPEEKNSLIFEDLECYYGKLNFNKNNV